MNRASLKYPAEETEMASTAAAWMISITYGNWLLAPLVVLLPSSMAAFFSRI
ncbi:hypothetical protein C4D60_Mb09t23210 [Musa balbisiana]|uniref:Uncharacterized protein n=1 Tax=Musa balbisiana TaxID=52838 RepID=A0A4S8IIJ9_MUSBA|nr:hypothetical protein C4D60_Mb09t23210 [Musa balbisiana]